MRKYSDDLVREISVLAQRLEGINPNYREYGINTNARRVARINILLTMEDRLSESQKEVLEELKKRLIEDGRADAISHSDILTQLGAVIGKVGKQIDL